MKIVKPNFMQLITLCTQFGWHSKPLEDWFRVNVEPYEIYDPKLAVEVDCQKYSMPGFKTSWFSRKKLDKPTHTALLINITPVEADSPELLLKELLDHIESISVSGFGVRELMDRARKVLDEKK